MTLLLQNGDVRISGLTGGSSGLPMKGTTLKNELHKSTACPGNDRSLAVFGRALGIFHGDVWRKRGINLVFARKRVIARLGGAATVCTWLFTFYMFVALP